MQLPFMITCERAPEVTLRTFKQKAMGLVRSESVHLDAFAALVGDSEWRKPHPA